MKTMKKAVSIFAAAVMMLTFTACGQSGTSSQTSPYQTNSTTPSDDSKDNSADNTLQSTDSASESLPIEPEEGKTLIVYFTWSPSGNTEIMAEFIQEKTGGELLKLEPAAAYPDDYNKCGEVALEERDSNARPKISNLPGNIDEYDTIFIGYPIWWHTAPMIIGTFLESYDLTGADIYPFMQSDSMDTEQFGQSMEFVRGCAKGANVHDGLFVEASDTDGITEYLTVNGF